MRKMNTQKYRKISENKIGELPKTSILFLFFLIGTLAGVASMFLVSFVDFGIRKILKVEDTSFEIGKVDFTATVLSSGLNGLLIFLLPEEVYGIAAVVIGDIIYEGVALFFDEGVLSIFNFILTLFRDFFVLYLVLYILSIFSSSTFFPFLSIFHIDKNNLTKKEAIDITIITSVILNIALYFGKWSINTCLKIPNDRTELLNDVTVI